MSKGVTAGKEGPMQQVSPMFVWREGGREGSCSRCCRKHWLGWGRTAQCKGLGFNLWQAGQMPMDFEQGQVPQEPKT